jgi:hypothetical protein
MLSGKEKVYPASRTFHKAATSLAIFRESKLVPSSHARWADVNLVVAVVDLGQAAVSMKR